jgi:hypothetical protein
MFCPCIIFRDGVSCGAKKKPESMEAILEFTPLFSAISIIVTGIISGSWINHYKSKKHAEIDLLHAQVELYKSRSNEAIYQHHLATKAMLEEMNKKLQQDLDTVNAEFQKFKDQIRIKDGSSVVGKLTGKTNHLTQNSSEEIDEMLTLLDNISLNFNNISKNILIDIKDVINTNEASFPIISFFSNSNSKQNQ